MSPEHEMPDPILDAVCHTCHVAWQEPRGSVAGAAWQRGNPLTAGLFTRQTWQAPRHGAAGLRPSQPPLPIRAALAWQAASPPPRQAASTRQSAPRTTP